LANEEFEEKAEIRAVYLFESHPYFIYDGYTFVGGRRGRK
jgi:hypothetical protein